jgi:hypothetical protein
MTFYEDRAMGEQYQTKLLDLIEHDSYEIAKGVFKAWDVKIVYQGETVTFEVKADRRAAVTKNLAIEYACNGVPSGIAATEADYWVYFIDGTNKYYLIQTDVIRAAIAAQKYKCTVRGGDGMRAQMYLFGEDVFAEACDVC